MYALQVSLEPRMAKQLTVLGKPGHHLNERGLRVRALLQVTDRLLTIAKRKRRSLENLGPDVMPRRCCLEVPELLPRVVTSAELHQGDDQPSKWPPCLLASPPRSRPLRLTACTARAQLRFLMEGRHYNRDQTVKLIRSFNAMAIKVHVDSVCTEARGDFGILVYDLAESYKVGGVAGSNREAATMVMQWENGRWRTPIGPSLPRRRVTARR